MLALQMKTINKIKKLNDRQIEMVFYYVSQFDVNENADNDVTFIGAINEARDIIKKQLPYGMTDDEIINDIKEMRLERKK